MLEKRNGENTTQLAIRSMRDEFLADILNRLCKLPESPDLSAIGEQHKVGYCSGYRKALEDARFIIHDARNE